MRDRLIELIEVARNDYNDYADEMHENGMDVAESREEYIADYLLGSGVIVPPCKVGDTVWLIPRYNGKPMGFLQEDKVQMIGITSRGIHIKAINHHDHNKMYMLGKTVFLTREEAERALRKEDEGK